MPFLDYYFQKKQTNFHLLYRTEEIKHTTCLKKLRNIGGWMKNRSTIQMKV